MNDDNLKTIDQIQQFLKGSEGMEFTGASIAERYNWMEGVLVEFRYLILRKPEKGVIRRYIMKMTGYSCSQVSRVIADYKQTGRLRKTSCRRHHFPLRYTRTDELLARTDELLARTDELHLYLSGPATKKIMEREYEVYGHTEFERISQISVSHLYNLRGSNTYRGINRRFTKTRPAVSKIGERIKPDPQGHPWLHPDRYGSSGGS